MAILTDTDRRASTREDVGARFCSRCGTSPAWSDAVNELHLGQRVCPACEMGVLLGCARLALPGAGRVFLVVSAGLAVSAVSEAAEPLFGPQDEILGRDVRDLLSSPLGEERLTGAVVQALAGKRSPIDLPARGRSGSAALLGMLGARISSCGPPRAALVAMEATAFGRS